MSGKKCPQLLLMKCKILPQTALMSSYNKNNDNMNCIYTNTDTTITTYNKLFVTSVKDKLQL